MTLRRGFKSEAERIAKRIQSDLGLSVADAVEPKALAGFLGIEVRGGDELVSIQRFIDLEKLQPGAFSACTLRPTPDRVVIVYNPKSVPWRSKSDIAHELSHTLLEHELSRVERLADMTFLTCDQTQEEEARWLSGCLLLPRPLLLKEVTRGLVAADIAQKYEVSTDMATYRLNVTGVLRQRQAFVKRVKAQA